MRSAPRILICLAAALSCTPPPPPPVWKPGVVYPTPREAGPRGFLDRRGLIHSHSVYSHDACDGHPYLARKCKADADCGGDVKCDDELCQDGVRDPVCFEDFRRDLCAVQHDFVFLTDHRNAFDGTEYPEALLYRKEKGDVLVERDGHPVANRAGCADGHSALIMAGAESGTMPVGLEQHVADRSKRGEIYGNATPESIAILKANGAVVLVAHTEGWTADQLTDLPLDGFEMFNLHANTLMGAGNAFRLYGKLLGKEPGLPVPDLALLAFLSEDQRYLETWGTVLSRGIRRVTTMGTDCHRNSFPEPMADGERVDSYRRMMLWFSNHLLVKAKTDGSFDDRDLKDALRAGRLYGAFELFGYPVGFDFHAETKGTTDEMGAELKLSDAPVLKVTRPTIRDLDATRTAPVIRTRLLRAKDGGWDEVAAAEGDVSWAVDKVGAYRTEIRILPNHLREDLADEAETVLAHDAPWIYSNAIYVR